jgi:hypothetical protein
MFFILQPRSRQAPKKHFLLRAQACCSAFAGCLLAKRQLK